MSKRDAFELAIKLFAIFLIIRAIEVLPSICMSLATYNSNHVIHPYLYIASPVSLAFIYLFFAIVFFTQSNTIISFLCNSPTTNINSEIAKSEEGNITLWIKIVGLYYFVMSSGSLVSHILQLGSDSFYWWTPVFTKTFILGLSLCFIFRTSKVVDIIYKYSK